MWAILSTTCVKASMISGTCASSSLAKVKIRRFVFQSISVSRSATSQIIVTQSIEYGIQLWQLSHSVLSPWDAVEAGGKGGWIYCCLTPGNFFDK